MANRKMWCHTGWDYVLFTWSEEIDKHKQRLDVPQEFAVEDQRAFLDAFDTLLRSKRQSNQINNFGRRLHFQNIDHLVRNSDELRQHDPPQSLAALVYTATFLSILRNVKGPLEILDVVDLIGGLNHKVPELSPDLFKNFDEEDVQSSLRQIFSKYMEFLVGTIIKLDPRNTPSRSNASNDDIINRARRMSDSLSPLGEQFVSLLGTAMQSISTASVFTDTSHTSVDSGFEFEKELGQGSYGKVAQYKERTTGQVYAKKTIKLSDFGPEREVMRQRAQQEYVIMDQLQHVHIVRVCTASAGECYFSFYMRPVADMDLARYLGECTTNQYHGDALTVMISWFGCLLAALTFAHRMNIQHNDIKPSNILVKHDRGRLRVWLTDFGLARDLTGLPNDAAFSLRGTPIYRAPEIEHGYTPQPASDVYSLGCVFAEMLSVECKKSVDEFKARRTHNRSNAFRHNEAAVTDWLRSLPVQTVAEGRHLRNVIRQMLQTDPQDRGNAEDIGKYLRDRRTTVTSLSCGEC